MENVHLKQIQVNENLLVELITKVEEMDSLVETLEISLDKSIIKQVEQSKKDFAEGRYKKISNKKQMIIYLNSLG